MLPALLLFLGYFLLLTAMRSMLESGKVAPIVGLWPIHIAGLFLGMSFIIKDRPSGRKLKARIPRSKKSRGDI